MKKSKPIYRARWLRATGTAGLLAIACGLGPVSALADESVKDTAKKTEHGFGQLLKGMSQEMKKAGIGSEKKDDKKAAKRPDKKSDQDKDNNTK